MSDIYDVIGGWEGGVVSAEIAEAAREVLAEPSSSDESRGRAQRILDAVAMLSESDTLAESWATPAEGIAAARRLLQNPNLADDMREVCTELLAAEAYKVPVAEPGVLSEAEAERRIAQRGDLRDRARRATRVALGEADEADKDGFADELARRRSETFVRAVAESRAVIQHRLEQKRRLDAIHEKLFGPDPSAEAEPSPAVRQLAEQLRPVLAEAAAEAAKPPGTMRERMEAANRLVTGD